MLSLIKAWLKAPVEETDPDGRRRLSGGKRSTCGTPQGGGISPLLANRYMNRFLRHWRNQGRGEAYQAHVVNYADEIHPGDAVFEARGVKVVVDPLSLPLIDGTLVDFVKQGLNEAFKFQNPKAKGECGCGESFNV